jgi:hypothetical protein
LAGSVNGKVELVVANELELWSKVEAFKAREEYENAKILFANEKMVAQRMRDLH